MSEEGPSPRSVDEQLVALIVDEYLERRRDGANPSIEEYADRYPHLADTLRNVLPLISSLKSVNAVAASDPAATAVHGARRELGAYKLVREVGRGGMGIVYEAFHSTLQRRVALKVLSGATVASAEAVARFQREARAAARLNHPNIVTVHDAGSDQGMHFIVMEYVEGQDLAAAVKSRGPLPISEALNYIRQAATGLAFAHAHGVVHRDIKPGNLLVDNTGHLKILDMGLARVLAAAGSTLGDTVEDDALTQTGQIAGTVDFMAPEQALDSRRADARSDIYSLGCALFYLVHGHAAFRGDTLMLRLQAHQTEPIPALGIQPERPDIEAAFQRMLAKRPDDRFATMDEVIAAFDACGVRELLSSSSIRPASTTRDLPTAVWTGASPEVKPRRGFSQSRFWLVAVIGLAAVGAVVAWALISRPRGNAPTTGPAPPALAVHAPSAIWTEDEIVKWSLEAGGKVTILDPSGIRREVVAVGGLPARPYRVVGLDFTSCSSIRDEQLAQIASLKDLQSLNLAYTHISDAGLAQIARIGALNYLRLVGTRLSDDGLNSIARLSRLEYLDLSRTRVTNDGLANIAGLSELSFLALNNAAINDSGLARLHSLRSLRELELRTTNVTDSGVDALRAALPACQVKR